MKKLTTKILEFIRDNPGVSIKDVSVTLSISMGMARTILYRLKSYGYIQKAGSGYILTDKGEWYLSKSIKAEKSVVSRPVEETEKTGSAGTAQPVEGLEKETGGRMETPHPSRSVRDMRITELEEKIRRLEAEINALRETIGRLEKTLEKLRENAPPRPAVKPARREPRKPKRLPSPIMAISEAQAVLGGMLDSLISSGLALRIGRLVVDREFFEEFKKRFPLNVKEAEKLSPMEKTLLEELKREAMVILRANRSYAFVG